MHGIVFFAVCVRDVCLSGCSWGDTDVGYQDVFCLHENQAKRCISQGAKENREHNLGGLGELCWRSWGALGAYVGGLAGSEAALEAYVGVLRQFRVAIGASCGGLGPVWGRYGASVGGLGGSWTAQGRLWGRTGATGGKLKAASERPKSAPRAT